MAEGHYGYGRQVGEAEDILQARYALCRVVLTQEVDDLYAELCKACEQSVLKGRHVRSRRGQRRTSTSFSNSGTLSDGLRVSRRPKQ
jgi:hypothetical protein